MENVNYIITSRHLVKSGKPRDWLYKLRDDILKSRGVKIEIDERVNGEPVTARIYRGHWIADCDVCGGAMFVDPSDPVFFCFECYNRANNGLMRHVIFPPDDKRVEIERLILARPVNDFAGLTDSDRAGRARPIVTVNTPNGNIGLSRDWEPHENIANLKEQNKHIAKWNKTRKGG